MPKIVEVPGVGNVEFPDDMTNDAIAQALKPKPKAAPTANEVRDIRDAAELSGSARAGEIIAKTTGAAVVPMLAAAAAPEVVPAMLGGAGVRLGGAALAGGADLALGGSPRSAAYAAAAGALGVPAAGRGGQVLKFLSRFKYMPEAAAEAAAAESAVPAVLRVPMKAAPAVAASTAAPASALAAKLETSLLPSADASAQEVAKKMVRLYGDADAVTRKALLERIGGKEGLAALERQAGEKARTVQTGITKAQAAYRAKALGMEELPVVEKGISDGRVVRDTIPNTGSIESSLEPGYKVLPSIRNVPLSKFTLSGKSYSVSETKRIADLAEEIKRSGEISPLIVVKDAEGYYILEGGHRAEALFKLGARTLPAKVIVDVSALK